MAMAITAAGRTRASIENQSRLRWTPERTTVKIAKGRGFTFDVVGESNYQDRLSDICGGKCEDGYNDEVDAQLVFISDNEHDPYAIGVMIMGEPVGCVSAAESERLRAEVLRINPDRRPVVRAVVEAGEAGEAFLDHVDQRQPLKRGVAVNPLKRAKVL